MPDLSSDSAAQGYKQASFSAQKVDGEKSNNTDVCPQARDAILQSRLAVQALLPLPEMRKRVPEFSVVNFIFLNLTVYNTGEIENS